MRLRCRCGSKENDGSKQPHHARTAPQRRRIPMCIF
nr:unnamed protein product [Callosobruchus chinensis]